METYIITTKKKMNKAEVIRSGEIDPSRYSLYVPEIQYDDNQRITDYNDFGNQLQNLKPLADLKVQEGQRCFYFEENSYPTVNGPIKINLSKVRETTISLSDFQNEIEEAYNKGFNDGQQITRTTFEIELEKRQLQVLNFESVAKDLRQQLSKEFTKVQDSAVSLSILIAEHILNHEAVINNDTVIGQVTKALQMIDNETIFKIFLHPYNLETLNNVKNELFTEKSKIENLQLIADEKVSQGSCILETSVGTIDASFKSQLEKVKTVLENAQNV